LTGILVASIVMLALSGLPALSTRGRAGEYVSTILTVAGATGALVAAVGTLTFNRTASESIAWQLPNAALALRLDPLAAAFLLPIFVLGALASVYGLGYWPASEHASAGRVRAFMGLLLAGMATVLIAAHAMLFLVAWETMAIAAFFLIAAEDTDAEVRGAAWLYLIATHIGTLALLALFVILRVERGTFSSDPSTRRPASWRRRPSCFLRLSDSVSRPALSRFTSGCRVRMRTRRVMSRPFCRVRC
jgi:hydrogenase-4 component B